MLNFISTEVTSNLPTMLRHILPEFTLLCLALGVLIFDVFLPRTRPQAGEFLDDSNIFKNYNLTFYLSTLVLLIVLTLLYCQHNFFDLDTSLLDPVSYKLVNDMVSVDELSYILKMFMLVFVFGTFCLSNNFLTNNRMFSGEYYSMGLFSLLGMMILASSKNMLTIYLSLELFSLPIYAMVAMQRNSAQAGEAALKYFVMGAIASGLILFGISIVYGLTGSLVLADIANYTMQNAANSTPYILGLLFICAGIAFKFGAAPFHMWMPDVYQGAPTTVTLFIATAPKLAAFGMAVRFLAEAFVNVTDSWGFIMMLIGLLSIAWGNIAAVSQTNFKRLLAYSGVSHMGFILLGLVAAAGSISLSADHNMTQGVLGLSSSLFYAITYALMSLAIFGFILMLGHGKYELSNISDYQGLYYKKPWLSLLLLILLFSMAGVPPFVGFFSKFAIIRSLIAANYIYPAVIAVLFTVIGAFYYLKMVWLIFFMRPESHDSLNHSIQNQALENINISQQTLISLVCLLVLALGLYSQGLMSWCVAVFVN